MASASEELKDQAPEVKGQFSQEFADALVEDLRGGLETLKGFRWMDSTGVELLKFMITELQVPEGKSPVVFHRLRKYLRKKFGQAGAVSGLGQWEAIGLTALGSALNIGTSFANNYLAAQMQKDVIRTQAAYQIDVQKAQIAAAQKAAEVSAAGGTSTSILPYVPLVGIGLTVASKLKGKH